MTPQQFAEKQGLKKTVEEDWNPYLAYSLMQDYAEYYHKMKVKNLVKPDVSGSLPSVKNCDNHLYEEFIKSGELKKQLEGNDR